MAVNREAGGFVSSAECFSQTIQGVGPIHGF